MSKLESKLKSKWNLWFHSFDSLDWTLNGYDKIMEVNTIEDIWYILNNIDITIGLYYFMKNDYLPIWDHVSNSKGGGYTYRCLINDSKKLFIHCVLLVLGETIINNDINNIIGVSVSPKSKNSIVRIWTSDTNNDTKNFVKDNILNINNWKFTENINKKG
jgi:hypothetical protein